MTSTSSRLRARATVAGLGAGVALLTGSLAVGPGAATAASLSAPSSLAVAGNDAGQFLKWRGSGDVGYLVQQATNRGFSQNVRTYRLRGPGHALTPYDLHAGTTYYFRVRAVSGGSRSPWSGTTTLLAAGATARVRMLTYNVLSESTDPNHPGGVAAPFSDRRTPMLDLIRASGAPVVGIQEGSACLRHIDHQPCYRQIDSIADGLVSRWTLADTWGTSKQARYSGQYVLYDSSVVSPAARGGSWVLDNGHLAAYQLFRVRSTGARFLFVCVHLQSGKGYDQMRGEETKSMLRQARTYATNAAVRSIVYAGDFNSYHNEWETNDITGRTMRAAGVPDGIEVAQAYVKAKYDSINGLYRKPRKGHGSIDHIYATGGVGIRRWGELLNLRDGEFVGTIPSDHNPVFADLMLPS
jgi:endonuclease/exonuclease/phosphatase family metal-dependent hydrolase